MQDGPFGDFVQAVQLVVQVAGASTAFGPAHPQHGAGTARVDRGDGERDQHPAEEVRRVALPRLLLFRG